MVPRSRRGRAAEAGAQRRGREVGRVGVPAWRDPQQMLGGLVLNTVGGSLVLALSAVWDHLHIVITWR